MLSSHQISVLDASMEAVVHHLDLSSLADQRLFITGGTGFFGVSVLSALRVLRNHGIEVQTLVSGFVKKPHCLSDASSAISRPIVVEFSLG
jgi:hypothetical protein